MTWDVAWPFVTWLGNTALGQWLGQSTWRIAGLLTLHLFGLTILLGTVVVASLRLLGLFQAHKSIAQLRDEIGCAMLAGLLLMAATGFLIFTGGAEAYYAEYWFRVKLVLLAITLLFHVTVFRTVTRAHEGRFPPAVLRLTGLAALTLWFAVAWAGRSIAFF